MYPIAMPLTQPESPFADDPVEEVHLDRAPLDKVVAQVRFSPIFMVENPSFIAEFQNALRPSYPVTEREAEIGLRISSKGVEPAQGAETIWKFRSKDATWEVALGASFLSLVTTAYTTRDDLLARFREAVDALARYIEPADTQRLGLRYVDRLPGDAASLERLVRPALLGILREDLGDGECTQSISSSNFALADGAEMSARWGLLKPQQTFDLFIAPRDEPNWVLDIDLYSTMPMPIEASALTKALEQFATRIYRFFRWAVTPDFLRDYGATEQ